MISWNRIGLNNEVSIYADDLLLKGKLKDKVRKHKIKILTHLTIIYTYFRS